MADITKTAIITPFGLFEYLFTPFGLSNAAQTCQRLMDQQITNSLLPFHGISRGDTIAALGLRPLKF
jgi:hypothetical protein